MDKNDYTESNNLVTSSGAVRTGPCLLDSVLIVTDGTNDASVILYDNASAASGKVIFKGKVSGASNFGGGGPSKPCRVHNGIYLSLTGTGAGCIVYAR